jgi:hypothetical protein
MRAMFLPGLFLAVVFALIVAGAQVALELALPQQTSASAPKLGE